MLKLPLCFLILLKSLTVGKLLVCEKISLLFDPNRECILIQSPNVHSLCVEDGLWQTIKINSNTTTSEPYQNILIQQAKCAIGIFGINEAMESQVIELVGTARRNFVMTIGTSEEMQEINHLKVIQNNILGIWVSHSQSKDDKSIIIYRKCPVMSERKKTHYEHIMTCTATRCLKIKNLFTSCPNPMKGQKLLLATPPGAPDVILPVFYGEMGGVLVRMFQIMAQKFEFEPEFWFGDMGQFVTQNRTFSSGGHKMVLDGDADFGSAGHHILLNTYFDLPSTTAFVESKFVSRLPRQEINLNNIVTPFDYKTWILIITSLIAFSLFFMLAHMAYNSDHIKPYKLSRQEKLPINFFLLTFGLFTEPEFLPWFKVKWSAGKVGTGLWLLLSAHVLTFYNSNLRAHLISVDLEKSIDTLQDVLDNGKRVWIYVESLGLSTDYLKAVGREHDVRYKIAELAERTGGWYNAGRSPENPLGGLHPDIPLDLAMNRAVALAPETSIPYWYKRSPYLERELLHVAKETTET